MAIRFPQGPKGPTQGTSVQMQCSHGASHGGHHLELVTAVTLRNRQKYDLVSHVFVDAEPGIRTMSNKHKLAHDAAQQLS